jgi:hypothetical protein
MVACIDDTGDHRGFDVLLGIFHKGEFSRQRPEFRGEATTNLLRL